MSTTLQAVFAARERLAGDFFGGWEPEDETLFRRYADPKPPVEGAITDFLGIRTSVAVAPWAQALSGTTIDNVPIPGDGFHAQAIEYFALLHSLETAGDLFCAAEIGASYAPWTCIAAVLATRTGRDFDLVAVEASELLAGLIPRHLSENGIEPSRVRVVHGAVADYMGTCFFPKISSARDNGAQMSTVPLTTDYRGHVIENEVVACYTLPEILRDARTDFIHVDVQGAEVTILSPCFDLLNEMVRSIFVGTHSRKIEGELIELFHKNGWRLMRECPTRFSYRADIPDIVGWTSGDGGQYWINPRL